MKATYIGKNYNATSTDGATTPSVPKNRVTATYVGGDQRKLNSNDFAPVNIGTMADVVDSNGFPVENESKPAVTTPDVTKPSGPNMNFNALGAGDYFPSAAKGYNPAKAAANTLQKGLTGIAKAGSSALAFAEDAANDWVRFFYPEEVANKFTEKNQFFNKWDEAISADAKAVDEAAKENLEKGGKVAQTGYNLGAAAIQAVPQLAVSLATGGGSTGAQAINAVQSSGLGATISNLSTKMVKDPQFWTSFMSMVGNEYQQAKADGASEAKATLYALGTSLFNAALESGGGIQTLPRELQGGKSAIRVWVDSMVDEGKEGAAQGIIERAMQNLVYGANNKVLSGSEIAKDFATEAAVGGILTAVPSIASSVRSNVDANAQNATPNATAPRVDVEGDTNTPTAQSGTVGVTEANAELLYNKRDGNDGWGSKYSTAREALIDAINQSDSAFYSAAMAELDSVMPKNEEDVVRIKRGQTPINDAVGAVENLVRQDVISPMQAAKYLADSYKNGGVKSLRAMVNIRNGNLYPEVEENVRTATQGDTPVINTTVEQPTDVAKSVGAAHPSQLPFSHAETLYGIIDGKANSVRPDDVPRSVDGKTRVSETVSTVKGAAATPDDFVPILENATMNGDFSYIPISNNETVQTAVRTIKEKGFQKALNDWTKTVHGGRVSQNTVVIGQLLYNNAVNSGDTQLALDILADYQQMGRSAARALQAMSILQKLTPENRLYMIRRSVKNMVDSLNLDTPITIDPALEQEYLSAASDAEADAVLDKIAKNVALQIPPSAKKIWDTLRYTNMLGNFKTQVRNTVGNTGMYAVSGVKNATAALIQRLTGANKTRSLVVDPAYRNAAKADFKNVEKVIARQGKYQEGSVDGDVFKQSVMDNTRVNTTKSKVLNYALTPLQKYSDVTQWLMNNKWFGDSAFARGNYARALGGYMKAQGITPEQWSDPKWQEANGAKVQAAREFAINDALENTFRDSNWLSDWVSRIGRRRDTPVVGKALAEGLLPFRRTPANILLRAEEYSPLGLINTAVKTVQKAKGSEDVTANDVTEQLAKSLTGTALFGLGMLGAALGFLRGAEDKDEEQAAFDDLTGHQPYSIEIDGKSYTLDWLTPASMPLFMGVEFMTAIAENGLSLKDLETALTSIADPMLEMSMMSGMSDAIDSVQYAQNNTMQFAVESALNYLTQGLTNTLLGQIERTAEDDRMTTYIDKNSDVPTWLQYQLGKASAKTPGWDYQQTEYVDAWGRTESGGTAAQRAFNNFLAPWYSSTISDDPLENEIQRVADTTGENVLPKRPEKYFNVDGERINLTAEQYSKYATTCGSEMYDLMQSVVNSSAYKKMSNAEKAEALNRAEEYATKVAKTKVSNYELDGWAAKAKSSGIAPAKYISVLSQLDKTNKGSSNVTQEEAQAALDATSLSRAEKAKMWNNINKNWKTNPYK